MKSVKILFSLVMLFAVGLVLSACGGGNKNKITIAEVAHSIFYAPQYIAYELGYFEDEGLEVEIVLAAGADKTMAALLSKDAQIGLMGPEASIYVYNGGQEDYAINFAQVTQCDGSFLMGRENNPDWKWSDLNGKEILGGRKGGVPEMTLEYVLKSKGLEVGQDDPSKSVNVRTDVQFVAMAGAFTSGEADYVALFEPTATALALEGKGYIVASVGAESGRIPYTAYCATKSYMEKNGDILQKVTNALYRGQLWAKTHTAKEIAELIHPQFMEIDVDNLTICMQRYMDIEAWRTDPYFAQDGFNKLMDVMELANELDTRPAFTTLVNNEFANKAIEEVNVD